MNPPPKVGTMSVGQGHPVYISWGSGLTLITVVSSFAYIALDRVLNLIKNYQSLDIKMQLAVVLIVAAAAAALGHFVDKKLGLSPSPTCSGGVKKTDGKV